MKTIAECRQAYHDTLLENFVPFWEKFSPDPKFGGFLCGFMRDGELFFEDKSVWQQGRSTWMFAKLYNEFGQKPEWLAIAQQGAKFMDEHCFDENGHMYFRVTRDGRPLVNRRYYFSEAFAIMGYVELFRATGEELYRQRALDVFAKMHHYYTTPGCFPPKVNPETRRTKGHSMCMIMLNVCQHMRLIDDNPVYDKVIDDSLRQIMQDFLKPEEKALLETVGPNGERLNSPAGRLINPGHSIETAWFVMTEAIRRKDAALMKKAIQITLWSLERGWDEEMGGIFYFVDVERKPVLSLEWDMKLLWPHCEAAIALLHAYLYEQDEKYLQWFEKVTDYMFAHFSDPGYPEWFGHCHRDGTPISTIKGSDWKGPFHNVRAFMLVTQLLEKIEKREFIKF